MTAESIDTLRTEALAGLAGASDERALEGWRTAVLGRSGSVTAGLRSLGTLAPETRREAGAVHFVFGAG